MAQEHSQDESPQAFLLKLSDALRLLSDPIEIQQAAMRILGEQLAVDRVLYSRVDDGENYVISDNYVRGDFPKLIGLFPISAFGEVTEWLRKGETVAVDDMNADARLSEATRTAFLQAGVYAIVGIPLIKEDRWVANFGVQHGTPRRWTDEEIALVQETAERTWTAVERAKAEEDLRRSEEHLRLILESAQGFAIFTTDADGTINSWYEGAAQVFGWSEAEILGQKCNVTFTPEDQAAGEPEKERETARREGISSDIRWHQRKDGSRVFINGAMHLLRDGQQNGFFKMGRDETTQRQAEEALRRSEEHLRLILESAKGYAIFTTDADGLINSWNPGAAHTFGWSEAEILGQNVDVLFTPEDRVTGQPQKELETARREGIAPDIRWHLRKDGSRVFINGAVHPLRDGQLNGFVKIGRDETRQRQAEEALHESQKQLQLLNETLEHKVKEKTEEVRQLASDLINTTQRERQRISRVLHDDLQQRIYAILMQLSFLRNGLPTENETALRELSEIERELAVIVRIARDLSIDLSPPILPGEGLSHAIEWLATRMREQYALPIELEANGHFVIPNQELHVLLFNCVRELLFNIVKHAGASRAIVAMAWVDHVLRIEVRDDGKGFPVNTPEEEVSKQDDLPRSLGLPTIRHQLSLFGGSMKINSRPGAGTQVILIVPIAETSQGVSESADMV
jgi:PAS domain S-box-containing protein